jgi:cell division septation protein DedD
MGSGGKRGGAGDRVLEGRHVIGLFVLMLLFSGVFFTLGFVMGRNQSEAQVRAAPTQPLRAASDVAHSAKPGLASSSSGSTSSAAKPGGAAANQPASEWDFYKAGSTKPVSDHLAKPAAAPPPKTVAVSGSGSALNPKPSPAAMKTTLRAPLIPGGAYVLQVAALTKEADALDLAGGLQKKKFPAFVLTPTTDHFYRVQVGPYADMQSVNIAKKGLESAGFKAILKK